MKHLFALAFLGLAIPQVVFADDLGPEFCYSGDELTACTERFDARQQPADVEASEEIIQHY